MPIEYKVVNAHDYTFRPDEKRIQKECDDAAREGWRLVCATASAMDKNGRMLLFFERERT